MRVHPDDPARPPVVLLLREHLADVARHSPPESIHALDLDALRSPRITFWTATEGDGPLDRREVLGCGALLELDPGHGEVKSMRTAAAQLRRGVASAILREIVAEARRRGYARLSLETGAQAAFAPARALYTRFGFADSPPFADYGPDPNSVFMTMGL
jgi:putative acetyltransferase